MSEDTKATFAEQLALEEYKSLKSELQSAVEESFRLELYAIGALGAFYSWYFIQNRTPWIALIPAVFSFYGFLRSCLLLKRIKRITNYLKEKFEDNIRSGWETYFKGNEKSLAMTHHVKCFWYAVLSITVFILIRSLWQCCCMCRH
jgi:hypothetical protein